MRAMLKKHGLDDKRDYTVVEGAFPNMRALLAEKKADLITAVLPFSINPELVEIGKPLFTVKDAHRPLAVHRLGGARRLPAEEQGRHDRLHGRLGARRCTI